MQDVEPDPETVTVETPEDPEELEGPKEPEGPEEPGGPEEPEGPDEGDDPEPETVTVRGTGDAEPPTEDWPRDETEESVQLVEPEPGSPGEPDDAPPAPGEVADVVAGTVDTMVPVMESWIVVVPSSDVWEPLDGFSKVQLVLEVTGSLVIDTVSTSSTVGNQHKQ